MFLQAPILHSWRNYLSYIHILASTSVRFPTTLAQGLFGKRSQAKDVSAQMTSSTAAGRWRLLFSSFILSACQALQTRLDICQVVSMNPFPFVPHLPPTFPMHQYRSRWPHKMNIHIHPISSSNTKVSGDNCLTHTHTYIYTKCCINLHHIYILTYFAAHSTLHFRPPHTDLDLCTTAFPRGGRCRPLLDQATHV